MHVYIGILKMVFKIISMCNEQIIIFLGGFTIVVFKTW